MIENYMGFPQGINGADLAERARQQAVKFGVELLMMQEGVESTFHDDRIWTDLADGGTMVARTNVCATGVEWRRLNCPTRINCLDVASIMAREPARHRFAAARTSMWSAAAIPLAMCSDKAAASRDLPIPGSPEIRTTRPSPLFACCQRRISSSISSSRPTRATSGRRCPITTTIAPGRLT
jgi:hypothetical protein